MRWAALALSPFHKVCHQIEALLQMMVHHLGQVKEYNAMSYPTKRTKMMIVRNEHLETSKKMPNGLEMLPCPFRMSVNRHFLWFTLWIHSRWTARLGTSATSSFADRMESRTFPIRSCLARSSRDLHLALHLLPRPPRPRRGSTGWTGRCWSWWSWTYRLCPTWWVRGQSTWYLWWKILWEPRCWRRRPCLASQLSEPNSSSLG